MPDIESRLLYDIQARGLADLDKIAASQKQVSLEAQYSARDLQNFSKILQATAVNGVTYTRALQDIAKSHDSAAQTFKNIAKTLLENDRAQRESTRVAEQEARKREQIAERESRNITASLKNVSVLAGVRDARPLDALIGRLAGGAAAPILGGVAAAGFSINLVKNAADQARSLQNLADEFGITAQAAFRLEAASKLVGETLAGPASAAARKLSQALEEPGGAGKKTAEELIKFGVSLNQNLGSALEQTLQKLAAIPDAGLRSAEAIRLFGESGNKIAEIASHLKDVSQNLDDGVQKKLLEAQQSLAAFANDWEIWKGKAAAAILSVGSVWSQTMANVGRSSEATRYGPGVANSPLLDNSVFNQDIAASIRGRGLPGAPAPERGNVSRLRSLLNNNSPDAIASRLAEVQGRLKDAEVRAQGTVANGASPQMITIQENELTSLRAEEARLKALQRGPRVENRFQSEIERSDAERYLRSHPSSEYGDVPKLQAQMTSRILAYNRDLSYTPAQRRALIARESSDRIADIADAQRDLEAKRFQEQAKASAVEDEFNRQAYRRLGSGLAKGQLFTLGQSLKDWDENDRANVTIAGINRASSTDALTRQLGFQQRLSTLQNGGIETAGSISGGLRNELAIAQLTAQTRRQAIEDNKDLYNDAQKRVELARVEADLTKQSDEARLSAAEKLLELQQKGKEETGNFLSGLVNAGIDGNVGGFFRSFGRQQLSTITSNLGKNLPFTLNSAASLGGTGLLGKPDAPSFLGKLLAGTPLGFDPGKAGNPALDFNSVVTKDNSDATRTLTAVLAQLGGVSTPSMPGASVLSSGPGTSIFGSAPSTFSALANLVGGPGGTSGFAGRVSLSGGLSPLTSASGSTGSTTSGAVSGIGSKLSQVLGGAGSVFSGQALNSVLYGGTQDSSGAWTSATSMERVGAGIAIGASTAGGIMGALSGFKSGGGRGITQGLASTMAAVAPFTGPAAPFLEAGATIMGLVSSLFPDPRKARQDQEQRRAIRAAFVQPASRDYSLGGSGTGANAGFSYSDGGGIMAGGASTIAPTIHINAMDAQSFVDWSQNNQGAFGQAMLYGLQGGSSNAVLSEMQLRWPNAGWS